jgi:curved DNA-binding protein CbpA
MPFVEDQIAEWKAAYRVLNAPLSASELRIKQSYRKLMKRWHPDLFPNGSAEQADATTMTRLINEAYDKIERAPLRYHVEAHRSYARGQSPPPPPRKPLEPWVDPFPNAERIEFWVRLVCGIAFGALMGFSFFARTYLDSNGHFGTGPAIVDSNKHFSFELPVDLVIAIGLAITFGVAFVRGGDKFWQSISRRWWLWP